MVSAVFRKLWNMDGCLHAIICTMAKHLSHSYLHMFSCCIVLCVSFKIQIRLRFVSVYKIALDVTTWLKPCTLNDVSFRALFYGMQKFWSARYCGYTPPPVITSISNTVTVTFVSNALISKKGFVAVYTSIHSATGR